MTLQERIEELEKKVAELTDKWNLAQLNRDPVATKVAEDELINTQSELNALKMRRPV